MFEIIAFALLQIATLTGNPTSIVNSTDTTTQSSLESGGGVGGWGDGHLVSGGGVGGWGDGHLVSGGGVGGWGDGH